MVPEFTILPLFLYRIGRADNPFGPAPWEHRGQGRFDISGANLIVASSETAGASYWAADSVTAFLEVLAAFRKWEYPKELLDLAVDDPLPDDFISGVVPRDWQNTHYLVKVPVSGDALKLPVIDLEAAATVAYINSVSSLRKLASDHGFNNGIHRGLILSDDRLWTQSLSIHAHSLADAQGEHVAGLCHTSKWGHHFQHDARCYTIYEDRISFTDGEVLLIDADLESFAEAASILNLHT
jgi:hypothetical protein